MPKNAAKTSSTNTKQPDTFESGLSELSQLISSMESGDASLADMLARYQRGILLLKFCEAQLQTAEQQLLELNTDGHLVPLDLI